MADSLADFEDEGTLVLEQRFAIVPEWVIDADISDSAYRLYSVLLRYGQTSSYRMPGRALLATQLKEVRGQRRTGDERARRGRCRRGRAPQARRPTPDQPLPPEHAPGCSTGPSKPWTGGWPQICGQGR